jgi:arylsulfatase A
MGSLHGFSCQLVADEAINWLESNYQSDHDKPFFLYVPFHEPHEPIKSPEHLVDRYREVAATEDEAQYFANVHNMDLAVGRLLQALDQLKLRDNTIVFFSSDNGPETLLRYPAAKRSFGRPGPLRGMKLWTTEAGIRVPGIIHWPGKTAPGQVCDIPISSLDLLPTFCSLAKVSLPKIEIDGMDISPILEGTEKPRPRPLFWFYYNALNEQRAAMRDGKWKLLAKFNEGQLPQTSNVSEQNIDIIRAVKLTDFSLYDLTSDIGETVDVASQHPEEFQRLIEKMKSIYLDLVETMVVWPGQ